MGLIEGRADEVVHACVCDNKSLRAVLLDYEDFGEEGSGLGDDEPAGFQ